MMLVMIYYFIVHGLDLRAEYELFSKCEVDSQLGRREWMGRAAWRWQRGEEALTQ